jgi:hypothetical protein
MRRFHLYFPLLAILLSRACFAQFDHVDEHWEVVDIANGTKPSFDFDLDGRLHVMGITEARTGVVWYASADDVSGPWAPQTIANGYFYGPGDLIVEASNTAHLAWHDHDQEDAAHVAINQDERLNTQVITPGTHDGWDNSLALTHDGDLRMASIFPSAFGGMNSLIVSSLVGDTWSSEALASGTAMYGLNTSIAIDSQNRTHVLYSPSADWTGPGAVSYAWQDNEGSWSIRVIESGINVGRFPSLSIDGDDQVHAAWINVDTTDVSKASVRYGVLSDDWKTETVARLESVQLGFSGARKLVSIDVDDLGNPHLAYGDTRSVTYAVKDPVTGWEETIVVATEPGQLNGLVVLRLNAQDEPGIAFWRPIPGPDGGIVSLAVREFEMALGDFDNDGVLTALDIDLLTVQIGGTNLTFDLDQDLMVTLADRQIWITDAAQSLSGDANLDGRVNFPDYLLLSAGFGSPGGWGDGDFDGSGDVQFKDFLLLSSNFGKSATAVTAVPEPNAAIDRKSVV